MESLIKKTTFIFTNNKDFLYFFIISIIGSGFTAFSPLIVAKILNPDGFGSYSLGMAIVFLFCAIFISSSQAPCIILANQEVKRTGKANETFTVLLWITATTILFSAIIFFVFKNTLSSFVNNRSHILYISVLFAFVGYNFKSFSQTLLLGFDRKKLSAIMEGIFGLSSLVMIVFIYLLNIISIPIIIFIYFPAGLLTLLFTLFFVNKELVLPFKINYDLLREIFHFTRWQIVGLTAVYLVNWGDNFVLRLYVHNDQIGIYNLAYKLFGGVIIIIYFVNTYFLPFLSKKTDDTVAIKEYLSIKRMRIFFMMLAGIIIGLFIIPVFINLVYGKIFSGAIPIFMILSIALIFFAYSVFFIPLFNVLRKYKIIQIAAIIQIITNISLDFVLVPIFGIYGSAVATVIGYTALFIIYEFYFRKVLKKRYL